MDFEKGKLWQTLILITENDIDNNEFSINNYNNLSIFKEKFKETQFIMFEQKIISIMTKIFNYLKINQFLDIVIKRIKKGIIKIIYLVPNIK